MPFHSFTFLAFFVLTMASLVVAAGQRSQKTILVVASAVFYMWWNPAFILLIGFSTAVDYFVARRLEDTVDRRRRRSLLFISLATNLGLLALFKYADFIRIS